MGRTTSIVFGILFGVAIGIVLSQCGTSREPLLPAQDYTKQQEELKTELAGLPELLLLLQNLHAPRSSTSRPTDTNSWSTPSHAYFRTSSSDGSSASSVMFAPWVRALSWTKKAMS